VSDATLLTTRTRKEVEWECKSCPECSGTGLTTRKTEFPGYREGDPPRPVSVAFYCHRCTMGRWIEEHHRLNDPGSRARFYDLASPAYARLQPPEYMFGTYGSPEAAAMRRRYEMEERRQAAAHEAPARELETA
jgi:hypothetical protein